MQQVSLNLPGDNQRLQRCLQTGWVVHRGGYTQSQHTSPGRQPFVVQSGAGHDHVQFGDVQTQLSAVGVTDRSM
jgi:hypothetical protein